LADKAEGRHSGGQIRGVPPLTPPLLSILQYPGKASLGALPAVVALKIKSCIANSNFDDFHIYAPKTI
jgi:hypothetical protein